MLVSIGNINLVDGTRAGGVGVTNLKFRVSRKIQVQESMRAPEVATYDRGNHKTTLSFTVQRTFPTQQDADIFILEHDGGLPAGGLVTLTAIKTNGQRVVRYLLNAALASHSCERQVGVSTWHTYQIIGGLITSQKPS